MIKNLETSPFHIVEESPWPFLVGLASFSIFLNSVSFFWGGEAWLLFLNLFFGLLLLLFWAKDVSSEGSDLGFHTIEIETTMKWSMAWFISSEVAFFFAFFWGFFNSSLSCTIESGNIWPPLIVVPIGAFGIPLLNTLILLSSGVSLTWAHHSLFSGKWEEGLWGLFITISLGIYFTALQMFEYWESTFSFQDSLFGSMFFLATGFHGAHVIIGSLLLSITLLRMVMNKQFNNHHMGFETSSWYWHFVDVVWLFLFCCIYWWGG